MVNIGLFLPFVLAASLLLIVPGPTILLVISQAATYGRRSVVPLVTGVFLGDFTAMTLSLLGLGALMAASAALFNVFKWIGALYLVYLGVRLWRANPGSSSFSYSTGKTSSRVLIGRAFIVTALNPKSIAFFVAFLPQFIDPRLPAFSQLALLGGTFLILAAINATFYGVFAGHLGDQMKKGKVRKMLNRCGGTILISAGIFTAAVHRTS